MKTIVKQLTAATFIAVMLLAGNIKAEGNELRALSHENNETALRLEKWMTNEIESNVNFEYMDELVSETEKELALEDWMTNTELWFAGFNFTEEADPALEIEDWMVSNAATVIRQEIEPKLSVESWMTNEKVFK